MATAEYAHAEGAGWGLETARIPHVDSGTALVFPLSQQGGSMSRTDGLPLRGGDQAPNLRRRRLCPALPDGHAGLIGPGTTVSHDALRLLARHGTGPRRVGQDGVRFYTAPPLGPDDSPGRPPPGPDVGRRRETHDLRSPVACMPGASARCCRPPRDRGAARHRGGADEARPIAAPPSASASTGRAGGTIGRTRGAADLPNQAINHAASAVDGRSARRGRGHRGNSAVGLHPRGFRQQLRPRCRGSVPGYRHLADRLRSGARRAAAVGNGPSIAGCAGSPDGAPMRSVGGAGSGRERVIDTMIERIKALFDLDDATLAAAPVRRPPTGRRGAARRRQKRAGGRPWGRHDVPLRG